MSWTLFSPEKVRSLRIRSFALAILVTCVAAAAHAAPPVLTPVFPTCLSKDSNALVSLSVKPETGWSSVRVYFRRAGVPYFYYLEMRSDGMGRYWAMLPRPAEETKSAEIQISVRDADGVETRSVLQVVDVKGSCDSKLTPDQERYAKNLVVGETTPSQAGMMVFGWQCVGIVSRITVSGQIRPDNVCRAAACCALIYKQEEVLPILLAGGGIVGGGIVIATRGHNPSSPTNPGQ